MDQFASNVGYRFIHPHEIEFSSTIAGQLNGVKAEFPYTEFGIDESTKQLYLRKTPFLDFDIRCGEPLKIEEGQVLIHCYEKTTNSFGLMRLTYYTERSNFEVALMKSDTHDTGLTLVSHGLINRNIIFDAYFASAFVSPQPIAYFIYDGYWVDTLDQQINKHGLNERSLFVIVHEDALKKFDSRMTNLRQSGDASEQIVNPLCLPSSILVKQDENQLITEMACFNYSLAFHPDEWEYIPPEVIRNMIRIIMNEQHIRLEMTDYISSAQGIDFSSIENFPDYIFISIVRKTLMHIAPQHVKTYESSTEIVKAVEPVEHNSIFKHLNDIDTPMSLTFNRDLSPQQTSTSLQKLETAVVETHARYRMKTFKQEQLAKRKYQRVQKAKITQRECREVIDTQQLDKIEELQKIVDELKQKTQDIDELKLALAAKEQEEREKEELRRALEEKAEQRRLQELNARMEKEQAIIAISSPERVRELHAKLAKERAEEEMNRRRKQKIETQKLQEEYQRKVDDYRRNSIYATERNVPLEKDPLEVKENRAPWEFRRYVRDAVNVI